jgi:alkylation response protein AidB-like acyl-CoA dehydrogenase
MLNFLTEEHQLIAESAQRVFADLAARDTQQRQTANGRLDGAEVGRVLADLGVLGSGVDSVMSSAQIQVLVAREAGAACLAYPTLETLATQALAARSAELTAAGYQSAGATGTVETTPGTSCNVKNDRLNGTARLVSFVGTAAAVIIAARRGDGVVLVSVAPIAGGVTGISRESVESDYPLHDLDFDAAVTGSVFERLDNGSDAPSFLRLRTSLLAAAEISGACRHMVRMTRDYLLMRSQFGQVLGSNQALKHALADSHVAVEAMTAAIDYAAAASDAGAADAEAAVAAAKHFAGRAGKTIADNMLQLHGAIGYTMEFPLHLFMRRVYRLGVSHGSSPLQSERLFEIFSNLSKTDKTVYYESSAERGRQ